ncbi:MAG: class I SAM-dependent methyltransferase [Pyrinomonadaceae bacterium]
MRDTNEDWEKLAQDNAYWAVLTEDEFKPKKLTKKHMNAFFATGRADIANLTTKIKGLIPDFSTPVESVIDFGCGVGRLLIPLAEHATTAIGIDISETMRAIALKNVASHGLNNVRCVETPEILVKEGVKVDWLNSYIVLQHIEPRRGYFIINDLLQCVKSGGIASLHIPLFKTANRAEYYNDRMMYFRNDYYKNETVFIDRDNYGHPDIQMYDYDANTVMALFHKNQMTNVHLLHDRSTTGIHAYHFIARRD